MRTITRELIIGDRFCGPPGAANGGIAGGSLAALLGETAPPAAEVTLRRPVPLGRPFAARRNGDGTWVVEDGDVLVGEVRPAPRVEFAVPAEVTLEQARAAAGRAPYFADPVFPGCFGCGQARPPGDGLRIFPGPVNGVMTAPWTPDPSVAGADGSVRPEVVWAALDCPSGIAVGAAGELPPDIAVVLGRMTATVAAPPRAGDQCRLVAWAAGRDGRKLYACSARTTRCSPPPTPSGSPCRAGPWSRRADPPRCGAHPDGDPA
jgi:hypothetical protein